MKPPRNSKEVSKFLGMFQWYAKFIKNYADLCEPLYNLKRRLKKFTWSIEAQKAFDVVKVAITKAPVLKLPDFQKLYYYGVIYGCKLNRGRSSSKQGAKTSSICFSYA
ncbi:hypothetical protein TNCV_1195931 [Trichonephila clavipes]|uniref:RNA-directed DNA polymerase n=1 Tax=Trichonephila clavipes TaxID=2585209 RepID=A0A8X6SB67_TRICX|nr:hypothetical protein TNCV_1195931 [Trichonephila clavipes]